jgi:hypothetical protein
MRKAKGVLQDERMSVGGQGLRKVKQEIAKKGGWERIEQRPNLKRFMVVGTLFQGTDSFGGINSVLELIPQRNNSLM